MNRQYIALSALLAGTLLIFGCTKPPMTPEQVVEKAYVAASSGNYEDAATYLCSVDFYNLLQATGEDYGDPAWEEFWLEQMGTDESVSSISVEEVKKYKAWAKVYFKINTSSGDSLPHSQLLLNQENKWLITSVPFSAPELER